MTFEDRVSDLDWGTGWAPLRERNALQAELGRELTARHPLSNLRPLVFGRCLVCDDVVASLATPSADAELAVIHWSGRSEQLTPDGSAWPYFEHLTWDSFVSRFLRGGEHL